MTRKARRATEQEIKRMTGKRERRARRREEKARQAEEAALRQAEADERYMREALRQARKAALLGEVPIGCVIVHGERIIGRGYNRRNTDRSTLAHAEISAIRRASKVIGDWRLEDCTLYVTLEPCQMCAGAIVQARIPRVVYGCRNPKAGCAGSVLNLLDMDGFNHRVAITEGVCGEECSAVLSAFFQELRSGKSAAGAAGAGKSGACAAAGDVL